MTERFRLEDALSGPLLERVRAVRAGGGVLAIPTDTLYGLAADPLSTAGCAAIVALKGRPAEKAMPVLVAGIEQLEGLGVRAAPELLARLAPLWPARLTVILPLRAPVPASAGNATLAVRVPDLAPLRALLRAVGPLTATSANASGEAPAASAEEVLAMFPSLDVVLDDGPSRDRHPSTLVDATRTPPVVLREGSVSFPGSS